MTRIAPVILPFSLENDVTPRLTAPSDHGTEAGAGADAFTAPLPTVRRLHLGLTANEAAALGTDEYRRWRESGGGR